MKEIKAIIRPNKLTALRAALRDLPGFPGMTVSKAEGCSAPARHVAFVGSHRKAAALRASLATKGADAERLAAMHSPAGIDIGAVTPEEIALSILTEIVELRRRGQRRSISILSSSKC